MLVEKQTSIEQLIEFKKKGGLIKAQTTRFGNFLKECTDFNQLQIRLAKFLKLLPQFEEVQTQIDILNDDDETIDDEWKNFDDNYFNLLWEAKSKVQPSNATTVKLPTITLPSFSGENDELSSFHDSFKTLIHDNLNLSNCQ